VWRCRMSFCTAGPTGVRISVLSEDAFVTVEVIDDGQGIADAPWGGGLRRLSESAVGLGGKLEVTATAEGGTALRWTAAVN
jgi:signal transduction histidine kinase